MKLTGTHTYAVLELSALAYNEIKEKLKEAGYDHAFMDNGEIDMHGIGIALQNRDAEIYKGNFYMFFERASKTDDPEYKKSLLEQAQKSAEKYYAVTSVSLIE